MSNPTSPFDAWLSASQDWAKTISPEFADAMAQSLKGMEELFPTMPKELMEAFLGKGVSPDGLDAKTRLLLTLQGLTLQGALSEPQVKLTTRHALEAGATAQEVKDTIGLAAMFGGGPVVAKVLAWAQDVMDKDQNT